MTERKNAFIEKKLQEYFKIYELIYENPLISLSRIAQKIGTSRSSVSHHLREMYEFSIFHGPRISLKPAQNYRQYASFLKVEDPHQVFENLNDFSCIVSKNLAFGEWNVMFTTEKPLKFHRFKGFRHNLLYGVKGATLVSKVVSLNWDQSMELMTEMLSPPQEKSFLYEEVPSIPWRKKEWILYQWFRRNVRMRALPVLRRLGMGYERYEKWCASLSKVSCLHPAFFPQGWGNYFMIDFLFESVHQKQLAAVLGMLPSTAFFFSVGKYMLARLSVIDNKKKDEFIHLILEMGRKRFLKEVYSALVIKPMKKMA